MSASDPQEHKPTLRRRYRRERRAIPAVARRMLSSRITEHVLALPELADARCVALYTEVEGAAEVATAALHGGLIERGLCVAYPRVDGDVLVFHAVAERGDLVAGFRGILEPHPDSPPVSLGTVDVIVVPGVAFTADGHRLGQGGGHYDRVLSTPALSGVSIGLAFGAQLVQRLPAEEHDQRVALVVTEDGAIRCAQ